MFRAIYKITIGAAFLLIIPLGTRAAVCEESSTVNFVARDPAGTYIPGAKVDIYKQELDVNGQPKPATRVTGGTTDTSLGRARLSWKNSAVLSAVYAIRVQTISKDNASFWYYDYDIDCGEEVSIEETLSGLNFIFRKADGNPLQNARVSIYSQLRDTNGSLLSAKNELLLSTNTGSTGIIKAYLPQGSVRSLGRDQVDYYVMEVTVDGNQAYLYNLLVADEQMRTVNFYLNKFRLQLKDASGRAATGAKVEVYEQVIELGNQYEKGDKVTEFTIGNDGYGYAELMPGTYVLGVKGENNEYEYFWDTVIGNTQSSRQSLSLSASFGSTGTCLEKVNLNINLKTGSGHSAGGLNYELYEQEIGASGIPYAGTKIGSGTTDSFGRSKLNFAPKSTKSYVLKVWDKKADKGEYWFFDAAKFVCGYDRTITKVVPALTVIWRDSQGALKKNFSFTLYAQQYDADGRPVISESDKIGDYKTGVSGQVVLYIAPYNTYRSGQSGVYALTAKDSNGNLVTFYDVSVPEDKDATYTAQISGISGTVVDARNKNLAGRTVHLYQSSGTSLGEVLATTKTDASGQFRFEYPAGTYAIGVNDDFKRDSIFWNINVKPGTSSQKLALNLTNFSVTSGTGEELPKEPVIKLYSLVSNNSSYYRDQEVASIRLGSGRSQLVNLAAGPYLAVYTGNENKEYGHPFYAASGQFQNIGVMVSGKYLLSPGQTFKLKAPTSGRASGNNFAQGSLSASVKGRILLQVQDKGQAWYVNPIDNRRYYLGRPADAFSVMQKLGLGISNQNFSSLQENAYAWRQLAGRILIKVEDKGKAYYFDPVKLELHYLGRPQDAFNVMRQLGLGITNANLGQISSSQ